MGLLILLIFICLPILEITVLIDVGERIGRFNTLSIVILTAIAGTTLLRWQGLSVLARAQESLRENRLPMEEVFDGLCIVFAGVLLLTPGFVTDTIGLLLFLPPFRFILKFFGPRFVDKRSSTNISGVNKARPVGTGIIDGDFQDITEGQETSNDEFDKVDHKDRH